MAEVCAKKMKPFTDLEKRLIDDPATIEMIETTLSKAARRGFEICDETRSNAYWAVCQAAKRFRPEEGKAFGAFAYPWVYGSIGRTRGLNMKYGSYGEDFLNYIPNREEEEVDEDKEQQVRMLKHVILNLPEVLKPVAELMLKSKGIRKIVKELGIPFHAVRIRHGRVREEIARQFGYWLINGEKRTFDPKDARFTLEAAKQAQAKERKVKREQLEKECGIDSTKRAANREWYRKTKQRRDGEAAKRKQKEEAQLAAQRAQEEARRREVEALRFKRLKHLRRFGGIQAHLRKMRVKDRVISLATVA